MSWYKWAARFQMTYEQALRVFGFPAGSQPSPEEVKKKYRDLARKAHPDVGGTAEAIAQINNANDVLVNSGPDFSRSSPGASGNAWQSKGPWSPSRPSGGHYRPYQSKEQPPWQTDSRSSYNDVPSDNPDGSERPENFRHLNYCMKKIYEHSLQAGAVSDWTISAFDGAFFRGVFTAKTNEPSLGYAGKVMQTWNSEGANPYPTHAVIAAQKSSNSWKVIQLRGQDVSAQNIVIESEKGGAPWNDRTFSAKLKKLTQGVDAYA